MTTKRVLIIGIDGGTWSVLKPAMDEGYMPFLKSLVDTGTSGTLRSTMPAITPAAWGSFQTGMNPGENGVHDFFQWDKEEKKATLVNSSNLTTTIWDIASQRGKRVGIINVPMTYPPKKVNGFLISGLLTPSIQSTFTFPLELKTQLLQSVPDYEILNLTRADTSKSEDNFIQRVEFLMKDLDNRAKAAKFVMAKEPFDLFMVHFQATDVLQHQFWCYLDKDHPQYQSKKRTYLLKNFYSHLDRKIQNVYAAFWKPSDDQKLTFIISDHGFQSNKMVINIGVWLKQNNFLKIRFGRDLDNFVWSELARKLNLSKVLSLLKLNSQNRKDIYDWNKTKAYARAGNSEGFIYLLEQDNKKRLATEKQIIERLNKLKDNAGNHVVKNIYKKHEIFHGKKVDIMPDLIVEPEDGYSFYGTYRNKAELFHPVIFPHDIVGKHHKNGIFLVHSKDIIKEQKNIQAKIEDITPTIAYAMSLPIRIDSDGDILKSIFFNNFLNNHPEPNYYTPEISNDENINSCPESNDLIKNRLENLGYL